MKTKIQIVCFDEIPGGRIEPCPGCKKPVVINEDTRMIYHMNPMCEWFEIRANVGNALLEKHKKSLN